MVYKLVLTYTYIHSVYEICIPYRGLVIAATAGFPALGISVLYVVHSSH